jgi:hypothetical protein
MSIIRFCIYVVLGIFCWKLSAQDMQRPVIWVTPGDRSAILEKIDQHPWAKEIYTDFINRIHPEIEKYNVNTDEYLKGMPFDWDKQKSGRIPPFLLTRHMVNGEYRNLDNATRREWAPAGALIQYLQTGLDCGIAYYLTGDEQYAQVAVDILYTFIQGVLQAEVSAWRGRGGWLFPDDGFREVREIGYKVPIIYDFVAEFIRAGAKPYDFAKRAYIDFPREDAQHVFRTYADITVNYGQTGSNHPILEAPNLVYNALAMDNESDRRRWLSYFLTESTENQDALNIMAEYYKNKGDIWPETSQYFNHVSSLLTRLMLIVNRYDPSLRLGEKYPNILYSLPALDYLVYPNNQIIRWGDGKRSGRPPYASYEDAFLLGKMDGVEEITNEFSALLHKAFSEGKYQRRGIMALLWYDKEFEGELEPFVLPRTDEVPHAGIFLQRNLSETSDPKQGLMCFVGGAHMVHGHAEGMNIELYGCGHVLGVDNGNGSYQQDIHENYSRVYAAHNTVIVNGSSQGEGGWVNLGINTVELVAMEPMPREEAISPYHSFSTTSFVDDKGDKAEAYQERTLALIRTSNTTGYYLDVFRSKSKLPNEYHDYLYHNIGDKLDFLNGDLNLMPTPERYMANADLPWVQNRQYRHPGWHFFEGVKTSSTYKNDVHARFSAEKFEKAIFMDLHIPGFENREYSKVMAPHTFEAPRPYLNQPTPTLVVRKKGEAWDNPFVVVFEPFEGQNNNSIVSVEKLMQDEEYKGVKVVSHIEGEEITQYLITLKNDDTFVDEHLKISFSGTFAVITFNSEGDLQNMYIGEGDELKVGAYTISPKSPKRAVFREFQN